MIRRSTWAMVVIFLVLLTAAWLWQRSRDRQEATQTTPTSQPVLLNINPEDIRKLDIENVQGQKIVLEKKEDGSWKILGPEVQLADTEKVNLSLNQLAYTQILNTLVEPPAQEQIGLVSPLFTLKIDSRDGRRHTLYVGNETPTQSGYYVRYHDQIYVVGKFALDGLVKMLENPPVATTPTSVPLTPQEGEMLATPEGMLTTSTTVTPTVSPSTPVITATVLVSATPVGANP